MSFARRLSEKLKSNFSTFQLFNFSTVAASAAALAVATAKAAEPADTQIGLGEVGLPIYGASAAGSGYVQPTSAYPISAAAAPTLP